MLNESKRKWTAAEMEGRITMLEKSLADAERIIHTLRRQIVGIYAEGFADGRMVTEAEVTQSA